MSREIPKTPSSEEMAKIKKERTVSDAELLKDGAEYKIDTDGNEILSATDEQIESARKDMEKDLGEKDIEKKLENMNDDEKNYFDSFKKHAENLNNLRALCYTGQLTQQGFNSIVKKMISPFYKKNIEPLEEKIDEDKSSEIIGLVNEVLKNTEDRKIIDKNLELENKEKTNDLEQQKKASEKEDSAKIEEIREKLNGTENKTDNKEVATPVPEQHKIKLPEWRIDEEVRNMSHTDEMKIYSAAMDLERITQELNLLHNEEKLPSFEYDKSMRERVDKYNKKVISLSGKVEGDRQREIIDIAKRKTQFQISNEISRVNLFDELYKNIKKFSSIDCSDNEKRLPKKYISMIEDVRNKKSQIESIPEIKDIDANIKNKIKELMKKDVGPGLPPDTEWLMDEDIKRMEIDFQEKNPYSMNAPEGFEEIRQKYLKIGESGLETEYGQVNGFLVWCDGNTAIFETPQGKIMMPFRKLMHPSGKTYEQIEKERKNKEHRKRILNSESKSRYVEN